MKRNARARRGREILCRATEKWSGGRIVSEAQKRLCVREVTISTQGLSAQPGESLAAGQTPPALYPSTPPLLFKSGALKPQLMQTSAHANACRS